MKIEISARFAFNDGKRYKKVTWVEEEPKLLKKDEEGNVEQEIPLDVDGVEQQYRRLITKYMKDGEPVSLRGKDGMIFIIQMRDVWDVELDCKEVIEDVSKN